MKKWFCVLLVVVIVSVLISMTPATSSGNGYGYNYNYNQQYQYQHQNYNYQVNPVVVIGVPVSNLGVPFYWSVGQELREERIAEKAAAIVKGGSNRPVGETKVQKPEAGLTLDFDLVGSAAAGMGGDDFELQVKGLLTESCVRCHKPGSGKPGNIQLFNNDGSLFKHSDWKSELQRREMVYDAIRGVDGVSPMPKNAEQLSGDKIELIYQWLRKHSEEK